MVHCELDEQRIRVRVVEMLGQRSLAASGCSLIDQELGRPVVVPPIRQGTECPFEPFGLRCPAGEVRRGIAVPAVDTLAQDFRFVRHRASRRIRPLSASCEHSYWNVRTTPLLFAVLPCRTTAWAIERSALWGTLSTGTG